MEDPLALLPPPFNSCLLPSQVTHSATSPAAAVATGTATSPPKLITQGAEALLFRTTIFSPDTQCALKVRPRKHYRHPTLDARLTRQRLLAEARVLVRCRRLGVAVPAVLAVDWDAGWIACEWIYGRTVRQVMDGRIKNTETAAEVESDDELRQLMGSVGRAVGKLHDVGVVHGDLTTSNLMVREQEQQHDYATVAPATSVNGEVVIIDFGLGVQSAQDEDRAVDLYVLERAFVSTHPLAEGLFKELLKAYTQAFRGGKVVLKKLEEVRQRGRKKSMLG